MIFFLPHWPVWDKMNPSHHHLARPPLRSHYSSLSFTSHLTLYFFSSSNASFQHLISFHTLTSASLPGPERCARTATVTHLAGRRDNFWPFDLLVLASCKWQTSTSLAFNPVLESDNTIGYMHVKAKIIREDSSELIPALIRSENLRTPNIDQRS